MNLLHEPATDQVDWIVIDDAQLKCEEVSLVVPLQRSVDDFISILKINFARRGADEYNRYVVNLADLLRNTGASAAGVEKAIYSVAAMQLSFVQLYLMPRLRWRALYFFSYLY